MTQPALARSLAPERRSAAFDARAVLAKALRALDDTRAVAVFDLDSTLLDNRPRQARILREFGASIGDPRLATATAEQFVDWHLETPMRACGLSATEVEALLPQAKAFWRERFFTSAYCVHDVPMPGASAFLARVTASGAVLCYVTGRHEGMRMGTLEAFRVAGFPLPVDHGDILLLMKPDPSIDDDAWKRSVKARLEELGTVRAAFDNEPAHINGYREDFPDAHAVHLDTDHSGREIVVHAEIPSVPDFMA